MTHNLLVWLLGVFVEEDNGWVVVSHNYPRPIIKLRPIFKAFAATGKFEGGGEDSGLFKIELTNRLRLHVVGYFQGPRYSRFRSLFAASSPMTFSLAPSHWRLRPSLQESMPSKLMLVAKCPISMSHVGRLPDSIAAMKSDHNNVMLCPSGSECCAS